MVQWLRSHAPNAGGLGLIPGQRIRSHMLHLRIRKLQLEILRAATRDPACCNQDSGCNKISKRVNKHLKNTLGFVTIFSDYIISFIFIIYCCITNCLRIYGLTQHTSIILQHLWVSNRDIAELGLVLQTLSTDLDKGVLRWPTSVWGVCPSIQGIFQGRTLEWGSSSSSRGSSQHRDWTASPASPPLAGRFFTTVVPRKPVARSYGKSWDF